MKRSLARVAAVNALVAIASAGATPLPADFESETETLAPIFAYFGGVGGITVSPSAQTVFDGASNEVLVQWQPDAFFGTAGAVVGDNLVAGADLNVPAGATVFSLAVLAPQEGVFSMEIALREDDNGDGAIDPLGDDDDWASPRVFLEPGARVYNFALADFVDTNESGDGVQGFETTGAVGFQIIIETRETYTGGMVQSPRSYFVDHIGFFTEDQTLPNTNPADLNGDGAVDATDLGALITAWGQSGVDADLDGDGVVGPTDLGVLLAAWG